MKAGIAAVLVLVFAAGGWWWVSQMGKETMSIGISYSKPVNDSIQFELMAITEMSRENPVPVDKDLNPDWDAWDKSHFTLTDGSGNAVKLSRSKVSDIVPQMQQGNLEHFLVSQIKPGSAYEFDYSSGNPAKKFVYKFTVPSDGPKFTRVDFEPQ